MKKKNSDAGLEDALKQVGKEIEDNGLQSTQPKVKQENKKMAKKTAKKTTKAKTKSTVVGYVAKDLAAEFDIAPADLRKGLRAIKATKPGKSWAWPKKTDSDLVQIRKDLKAYFKDQAAKAKSEKAEPKKSAKKVSKKKTSKKKS